MPSEIKRNIWYISKYFAPKTDDSPGGRGWLLLLELRKLGYNTTVITSDSNNLSPMPTLSKKLTVETVDKVDIVWLKTLKYRTAKSIRRTASWIHFEYNLLTSHKRVGNKPDLIVASSLSLLTVLSGLYLKHKYKCKLIFEVRDIWPLTITEEGGYSKSNPFVIFLGWIEKIGYKHSDAIIGTMPNLGEHVQNVLGYAKKTHCVPMGYSSTFQKQDDLSSEYIAQHIPKSKFKVGYAGTIGITNALDTLFEAADFLKQNRDVHILIIGDGALKTEYQKKYSNLPNLSFAPKVAKNQVNAILQQCDVVYLSTFRSEVWSYGQSLNKIIDYMLSGKPVVASYSGYPSMINEANCGFFIPAEDPKSLAETILQLHATPENERSAIGKRGRDWLIENRNYKRLGKEFSSIIENTLECDQSPSAKTAS